MKIILPTSIILAAIILIIGFFIFNYYENIQIRKSCETIATHMTVADIPDNVLDNLKNEVDNEYPWNEWAAENYNTNPKIYDDEYNKRLNKKINNFLNSNSKLKRSTVERCVLKNS